uniref:IRG-type G domain-containing protein n=1 Tax=Neogobius melanostomus TaxID=47308 RepID=A0A8C6SJS9_9GOBI
MEEHMKDPNIKDIISKCRNRSLMMTHIEDDPNMKKREEVLKTMGQMMENVKQHLETGNIRADIYKEEIKTALQSNDQALAVRKAQEYVDEFNNVHLNIAITGESGSGKSTLVNALRGIRNNTQGAAPTGVWETTMKPTEYLHPEHPNIRLWDLPGVGSTKFPADKYMEYVKFEKYDFFIIVSNDRFRENDAKLAKEIHKMKKKFYFVRSKIDLNVQTEKEDDPDFNEEKLLKSIRENCTEELQKLGFESPKVFLVSGLRLHLYEFKDLWKTLEKDLLKLQRDVLLLPLSNISLDVIQQKKKSLESKIKWFSAASAAGAAVPIPGVSEALDLGMIIEFNLHCLNCLGLTRKSLKRLSDVSGVSLEDLRAELKWPLSGVEITKALMLKLLSMSATYITAAAIEEGFRFIPLTGTVVAMAISSTNTYRVLTYVLNSVAEDAQRVFMKALD